ncbi:hypothetical protein NDU88_005757 [Pleurodeles waltl]|uniref:Uncharacterized protein n=1 Tax=Pleurodeles waltl TaxID=8319 RepID=A0AAV7UJ47_PLEWA|nr:hypothetical protein NDU88_005757 [Pleurodeles waltl]
MYAKTHIVMKSTAYEVMDFKRQCDEEKLVKAKKTLKTSRQKIGRHEPVGPGIGPQPRCLALPLSTAEKHLGGVVEAKPARLRRQR